MFFHGRGIGDSSYSSDQGTDEITMESLARDLVFLIAHLRWQEVANASTPVPSIASDASSISGYPRPLGWDTICSTSRPAAWPTDQAYKCSTHAVGLSERKGLIKRTLQSTFYPVWLHANAARFEHNIHDTLHGRPRPPATIGTVFFDAILSRLQPEC
ncbi:hypothetical protein C8R43DRAFT_221347 [Mycena crocata]|nr:hypothetical protein C8R43DRAFT_221347 [Mycena crocata]